MFFKVCFFFVQLSRPCRTYLYRKTTNLDIQNGEIDRTFTKEGFDWGKLLIIPFASFEQILHYERQLFHLEMLLKLKRVT